nr:peroxidase 5-like [Ipomoea batatas]
MKSEGDKVTRLMLMVLIVVTISTLANVSTTAALQVGFYHSTCPHAEAIVRKVVKKAVRRDPSLGAGLLRLHFHDCFVRGCDASVLLDSTQNNKAEKDHPANNPSLRGFNVIDKAKHRVESQCPHTVSCADIVAFAARDSAAVLGGINYGVPAGRRDGRVSLFDDPTRHLPSFLADAEELEKNFGRKGLSLDEMVTLSGAHSVGRSHCSSFTNRLYSSNSSTQLLEDPSLEAELGNKLRRMCPRQTSVDPTAPLDFRTPNRLDNEYYVNLMKGRGVLTSDQTLADSPLTARIVRYNANYGGVWAKKFAAAMVKMGSIEVLTGEEGEIRKSCRVIN